MFHALQPSRHAPWRTSVRAAAPLAGLLAATSAQAHHPMGGAVPATLWQGLLSGVAHPVIAIDHLLFVLAFAMWVALSLPARRQAAVPLLAFVVLSAVGVLVQAALPALPGVEWVIGGALLAMAAALWRRRATAAVAKRWAVAAAGAAGLVGLAHGLAYGEAVIGAEATPVGAYLVGLAIVQVAVMAGVVVLTQGLAARHSPRLPALAQTLSGAAGLAGLWVLAAALRV